MKYLIGFLLCFGLMGCNSGSSRLQEWRESTGKVKVLSTTPIIDDLVGRIGGERIDHLSLMSPSIDPHSYELVKGDDEKFLMATVVFYNGLGLEHSASLTTKLKNHGHAVSLGEAVDQNLILHDRGQVDPHIWLDVSIWTQAVDPIAAHLIQSDPEGRTFYEERAAKVKQELQTLDQWMEQKLRAIPQEKRYLVTSHDAFNYFTRRYLAEETTWKERFCAPEGLAPDGQLGFQDLERVLNHLETHQIQTLFPETNVSRDSLKKIVEICHAKGLQVKIAASCLYSDTLAGEDAHLESYEEMMKHNVNVLCNAWDAP